MQVLQLAFFRSFVRALKKRNLQYHLSNPTSNCDAGKYMKIDELGIEATIDCLFPMYLHLTNVFHLNNKRLFILKSVLVGKYCTIKLSTVFMVKCMF